MGATGTELEAQARGQHVGGDYRSSLVTYEEAFKAYRSEGDLIAAARAARTVGWIRGWVFGDWAVSQGWMGWACALVEQATGEQADGWTRLEEARRGSDLEVQRAQYADVVDLARRVGDVDLECEATASLGMMLVFSGLIDDGMAYLDRALAVICGGEVDELPVLEGCLCGLLNACERTHDVQRAQQWLDAAADIVRRRNLTSAAGYCRSHYAGILITAGRWGDAEGELLRAIDLLGDRENLRGSALSRLADLRLRQGRVEDAALLLQGLHDHEDAILPTARLHLAGGRPAVAIGLVERAVALANLADYDEAPLRALAVEAHLAMGDQERAQTALDRLTEIAAAQPAQPIRAMAATARARVAAATDGHDPVAEWSDAVARYAEAGMPVEAAVARLELAACLAGSHPELAAVDAAIAFDVLDGVGATRRADEAAALVRVLGGPARTGPKQAEALTKREREVLGLVGHGLTNVEIGERLYISSKTVEHHVGRILSKLGMRSRTEAAAYATRSGLT